MSNIIFNLLSMNVFFPVGAPIRFHGQNERSIRVKNVIQEIDKKENIDAVIFNEVIIPECEAIILKDMENLGFRYRTEQLSAPFAVYGGTLIFSKHPITMQDRTLFGDKCTTTDCLSAKGVNFARVLKNDNYFNIFSMHLQAWNSTTSQIVRESQIQQIYQFIHTLNIPQTEAVLFAGDLNIDLYTANPHLKHLMYKLDMNIPEIHEDSTKFTFDPKNNKLVGADDPELYQNEQYPNGCVDEYLSTLECPCCPSTWIDYTMYSSKHLQPTSSYMKAIMVKVPPFKIFLSLTKEVEVQDVTDHFPVLGHFIFPKMQGVSNANMAKLQKVGEVQASNTTNIALASTALALIIIIFIVIILYCSYRIYIWKKSPEIQSRLKEEQK